MKVLVVFVCGGLLLLPVIGESSAASLPTQVSGARMLASVGGTSCTAEVVIVGTPVPTDGWQYQVSVVETGATASGCSNVPNVAYTDVYFANGDVINSGGCAFSFTTSGGRFCFNSIVGYPGPNFQMFGPSLAGIAGLPHTGLFSTSWTTFGA